MTAQIIDGRAVAAAKLEETKVLADKFTKDVGFPPALAIIMVGNNPASAAYVNIKQKRAIEIGIHTELVKFSPDVSEAEVVYAIDTLNARKDIHGIIIQLPLPQHLDPDVLIDHVSPDKDVDGFHPKNMGALATQRQGMAPCTPKGILHLLKSLPISLSGKHAVVIGRSRIVGRPMASLLLQEDCTVTQIHSRSQNWGQLTLLADIVIVAVGQPNLLKVEHVNPDVIVIDVGSSKISMPDGSSRFIGDVSEDLFEHVAHITPVPGGVGPMTVAMLLQNTIEAARSQFSAK